MRNQSNARRPKKEKQKPHARKAIELDAEESGRPKIPQIINSATSSTEERTSQPKVNEQIPEKEEEQWSEQNPVLESVPIISTAKWEIERKQPTRVIERKKTPQNVFESISSKWTRSLTCEKFVVNLQTVRDLCCVELYYSFVVLTGISIIDIVLLSLVK